jgi:hypothetical protein
VVNVETVLLPVDWNAQRFQANTAVPFINILIANHRFDHLQFVRVWYRVSRSEQVRPG